MKHITDQQLRQILNTLDQTKKRCGQAAYDKRAVEPAVLTQLAQAIESVQRTLISLPTIKEPVA